MTIKFRLPILSLLILATIAPYMLHAEVQIILWDIHDVIIQKNAKTMLGAAWNDESKLEILRNINFSLLKGIGGCLVQLAKKGATAEEFVKVAEENNPALARFITKIANTQEPIQSGNVSTMAIIKKLKELGYKNYVGSNIGQKVFKDLITNSAHATFFQQNFELADSHVVDYDPDHPENVIKKKEDDIQFFKKFLQRLNIEDPSTVLFIDNDSKNTNSAARAGMQVIHHETVGQLHAALEQKLGITIAINQEQN